MPSRLIERPDVAAAAQAAADAQQAYAELPLAARADFLEAAAAAVDALGDALTEIATKETNLPAARLTGERARTVNQLRMFAGLVREGSWVDARIDTAKPDRQPLPKPDVRRVLEPLGPVAVFGASNFPLAFSTAGGDTASALAAGCPVVYKAHPGHPETCRMVGKALQQAAGEAGLPGGVFQVIYTSSNDENLQLVRHPAIRAGGFTGSEHAGRALLDAANGREDPIPFFAEMGSVNPLLILPGALGGDVKALARGLHGSFTLGVGQFCTKPGVVLCLADTPEAKQAAETLVKELAVLTRQTPAAPMLHAGIASGYEKRLGELKRHADVDVVAEAGQNGSGPGATLLRTRAARLPQERGLLEECFGPATLVAVAQSVDELQEALSAMKGQLTLSLHMTDADAATAEAVLPLARRLAGRVVFNGFPTGVEVCPSMQHGGPYPASSDARFTSVGTAAILRWARPVCYQDAPAALLPPALKNENPLGIWRTLDGRLTKDAL